MIMRVDFLSGVFSGEEVIPSPGRLLGALLSGAYKSGDSSVVDAVVNLSHVGQPDIFVPPYHHVNNPIGYSSGNPMTDGECRNKQDLSRVPMHHFGLPGGKVSRESCHTFISHVGYSFPGEVDVEKVSIAASHVGYLGKGGDFCVIQCVDSVDGARLVHVPDSSVGMKLRESTSSLVSFYDDNFQAIHCDGVRSSFSHTDPRISYGRWMGVESFDDSWVIISTHKPFKQRDMTKIVASVDYDHAQSPFPVVDNRSKVRGVAVPIDIDNPVVNAVSHHFSGGAAPVLKCQNISYWYGDGDYVSATPYIGHPDVRVAVYELEKKGYKVNEIHSEPCEIFGHSINISEIPPAPIPYQRWWVSISGGHGIVREGYHTEKGFGLFKPV